MRHVIKSLHQSYEAARTREPNGCYELPSTAISMVHEDKGILTCANFVDCRLLLLNKVGEGGDYGGDACGGKPNFAQDLDDEIPF